MVLWARAFAPVTRVSIFLVSRMDELVVEKLDAIDWLELPDHLLFEIVGKLKSFFDYARFGAVCRKWRSLIFNEEEVCFSNLPPQLPLLLVPTSPPLPHTEEEEKKKKKKRRNAEATSGSTTTRSCSFYRITDKKVVCPQIQLKMPLTRHFRGSGHGWLVTMDDDKSSNYQIQLINPFFFPCPKVIPLPPLTAFPIMVDIIQHGRIEDTVGNALFVRKAVITADPISNPKDYMVILIWGEFRRLGFYKPGQEEAWTPIDYDSFRGLFEDVIYYKGKVYAVHHHGTLAICNMENRMAMKILEPPVGTVAPDKKYLVESSGDLLQVHRKVKTIKFPTYSTRSFKVFKLSLDPMGVTKPYSKEVKDLRGHALFLGYNLSLSIRASDFPGCKPNCIYYTDDDNCIYYTDDDTESIDTGRSGPHDIGMFNLEDGSLKKHYPTNIHKSIWPNPIWIEPRLPLKKQAKENKVE